MRKHLIVTLIMLVSLSLSACTKAKTPTETSSVSLAPVTEIIEKTSTQITTSEPSTTEKSTSNIPVLNEEKKELVSNSTAALPQITEVETTSKPKPTEDKTTIKNISEPSILDEKVTVQPKEQTTKEQKVDIKYYVTYAKNYALNISSTYDEEMKKLLNVRIILFLLHQKPHQL